MTILRMAFLWLILFSANMWAKDITVTIDTPLAPPGWALMERELLQANSIACERFAAKYLDERGYLLHTPRWGTLDGPDDAIETFHNWTLLHSLGALGLGPSDVQESSRRPSSTIQGTANHQDRAGQRRRVLQGVHHHVGLVPHRAKGCAASCSWDSRDPTDARLRQRMRRFAGFYMNEDPEAPNYDPKHKIIRSLWTGSKGPMLRKATTYDWVGDPVPGRFHALHGPAEPKTKWSTSKRTTPRCWRIAPSTSTAWETTRSTWHRPTWRSMLTC